MKTYEHLLKSNRKRRSLQKRVTDWNLAIFLSLLTEHEHLNEILSKKTADFEANKPNPWSLDDAPEKYIHAMCRAVVGIRVDIKDVQAQFKLSQNKTAENRVGVVVGLKELRTAKADEMATLVEKVNQNLTQL